MKKIAVLLMGCGGVGRQLLQHVVSCRSLHANQGLHLRIVGVCDSKSFLVASDVSKMELNDASLMEICRIKSSSGSSLSSLSSSGEHQIFTNMESTIKVLDTATLLGRSTGLAVVDCSASAETIGVLTQVIDMGCCIVLANKKPLTSPLGYSSENILAFQSYIQDDIDIPSVAMEVVRDLPAVTRDIMLSWSNSVLGDQ